MVDVTDVLESVFGDDDGIKNVVVDVDDEIAGVDIGEGLLPVIGLKVTPV